MVSFTVLAFPGPYDAGTVVPRLQSLAARNLICFGDAALLTWPQNRQAPGIRPLAELQRIWMLDDAFWGMLSGMICHSAQIASWPAGGTSECDPDLADLGIRNEVLDHVRAQISAGTSALCLLVEAEVTRRIVYALEGMPFHWR